MRNEQLARKAYTPFQRMHSPPIHESSFQRAFRLQYSSENKESSSTNSQPPKLLSVGMFVLPVASILFPILLQLARSLPPNSSEQFAAVTALFVSNRAYLYFMAATIVGLAAARGSTDAIQLGRRVTDLTEELLYRPQLETIGGDIEAAAVEKPSLIRSLSESGLEESLDQVSTETQALVLPLLVSFLLALSIFLLPVWTEAPSVVENSAVVTEIQDVLSKLLPAITQVWNAALLALFTRSEIRRLGFELNILQDSAIFEWVATVSITVLACWVQFWPAQNFANMSLAILVARAIQLDSFQAVVGALSLLTLYDATSVFLIPAAGASELIVGHSDHLASTSTALAAAPESSAMGSVAIQKLTSGTFQPGLLVTKIGDRLGGSLGLGDAVFPALLVNFVKRFDDSKKVTDPDRLSLFTISIVGYLLGCLACEFAPLISTSGLPALVFIIPFMLGSVIVASTASGELGELISFKPNQAE